MTAEGNRFRVGFDDKPIIDATDDTITTPGKAGLWTKVDSVTEFDDPVIEPLRCGGDSDRRASRSAPRRESDRAASRTNGLEWAAQFATPQTREASCRSRKPRGSPSFSVQASS